MKKLFVFIFILFISSLLIASCWQKKEFKITPEEFVRRVEKNNEYRIFKGYDVIPRDSDYFIIIDNNLDLNYYIRYNTREHKPYEKDIEKALDEIRRNRPVKYYEIRDSLGNKITDMLWFLTKHNIVSAHGYGKQFEVDFSLPVLYTDTDTVRRFIGYSKTDSASLYENNKTRFCNIRRIKGNWYYYEY